MLTYTTMVRTGDEPRYKFAEVKYGKIVSINEHWVPLEEYVKFFEASALFLDITGLEIDGEPPAVGDTVSTDKDGYKIIHKKSIFSPAELKAYTVEKMKLVRDKKELEPIALSVEDMDYLFDADSDANTRMSKARQLLEDNNMESIVWTAFDNRHVSLTVEDFKKINIQQAIRSTELHNRYNKLKEFIYSLSDDQMEILTNDFSWDYEIPEED